MPRTRPGHRLNGGAERTGEGDRRTPVLVAVLLGVVVALLPGCALLDRDAGAGAPAAPQASAEAEVVQELRRVLRRRAAAVREGLAERFVSGLAGRGTSFAAEQRTYFDNLQQLPLAVFRYSFDPADVLRDGDAYWVVVGVHEQLAGFDEVPALHRDRYLFRPGGRGRLRLASVTDAAWEERNGVVEQPWEAGPVEVRRTDGVLGVFDPGSVAAAEGVLLSVRRGISAVGAWVPYAWSRSVVVYAPSDTRFLAGLPDLPGGEPDRLDGVTFPVPVDPSEPGSPVAGTRFVLHPRMLLRDGEGRDRLVRHELVHVAVGPRDDRAAVWLSEGLAEWVSVRPLAPEERALSEASLAAARTALATGTASLPPSDGFNGDSSTANYGLSWWACEHLAATYGEEVMWGLLEPAGADTAVLLEQRTGLTPEALARQAAQLMVATYG